MNWFALYRFTQCHHIIRRSGVLEKNIRPQSTYDRVPYAEPKKFTFSQLTLQLFFAVSKPSVRSENENISPTQNVRRGFFFFFFLFHPRSSLSNTRRFERADRSNDDRKPTRQTATAFGNTVDPAARRVDRRTDPSGEKKNANSFYPYDTARRDVRSGVLWTRSIFLYRV